LIYIRTVTSKIRFNLGSYIPVREDWRWNVILPGIAYGGLLVMALLIWRYPEFTLYAIAAISMLLLFVGIHNAWDIAVWMSLKRQDPAQEVKKEVPGEKEVSGEKEVPGEKPP
jgi:hypothetical protein